MWAVLALALLTAVADLPARWAYIQSLLPVVRLWADPDAQHRLTTLNAPYPYDILRAVDALVPADESVLLVTSGRDIGREEYITFHRALYFLAPRPVWWMAPTPSDGSWKSRWWISSPLSPDSVRAVASEKHARYVLVFKPAQPLLLGSELARWPDGYLLRMEGAAAGNTNVGRAQHVSGIVWPLQVLAALGTILLIGSVFVVAAGRLGYTMGALEALGLAWSLGAGLTTVLMLWLNALGLTLGWQVSLLTLFALALGLWFVVVRMKRVAWTLTTLRKPQIESEVPTPLTQPSLRTGTVLRGLLLFFLFVQVAFVIVSAVGRPLQVWDSWANWGMKSRIIFLDDTISPTVYADASRLVVHPDYPLLIPLAQAWLYKWVGAPDDRLAGVVSVLFYLSLLCVLYSWLQRERVGTNVALAAVVVVATVATLQGVASIVFAEAPLITLTTFAGIYLYKWLNTGSKGALLIGATSAGLLLWTKREGALLLLALVAGILLTNLRSRRAGVATGACLLGAVLLSGAWWGFISANHIVNPGFLPITPSVLQENISRWRTIWDLTTTSLLGPGFNYIWPLAAIAGALLLALYRGPHWRTSAMLPVAALLYALATAFIYFFSSFVPYEQHILSSIDRLLVVMVPLLVVWIVCMASTGGETL